MGDAATERFSQTLDVGLIRTRDWQCPDELRETIDHWLHVSATIVRRGLYAES